MPRERIDNLAMVDDRYDFPQSNRLFESYKIVTMKVVAFDAAVENF
jgi:hypothetical protein